MSIRQAVLVAALAIMVCSTCAAVDPGQIPATSWHGLTGLFVVPTARTIGPSKLAVGFNESKHTEFINNGKYVDRQIRGVATYGITDKLEVYASYWNNMYVIPPGIQPQLHNQKFYSLGAKLQILREDPHYWFPTVAIAVRDMTDRTADVGPLHNVNNGVKGFILASKKMLRDDRIGRFMDVHAGLAFDRETTSAMLGFELTLAPNASLIAEGVWDSPYLNFRNFGHNNQEGRYLFNTGLRIYPELVPGLVLDMGFVGDSEFEFSFGASYVISL